MAKKKFPPLAIKIISIVLIAYSVFLISSSLIGLLTMPQGGLIEDYENTRPNKALETKIELENMGFEYNESTLLTFSIIGLILFTLVELFFLILAILLWKGYNWARITLIVIGFVFSLFAIIGLLAGNLFSAMGLVAYLIVALTLLLNNKVQGHCKKRKRKS